MALNSIPVSPEVIAALVSFVAAAAGAYRYYRRTGTIPLSKLPWKAFRKLFYTLRVEFFTAGRPPETRVLDGPLEDVRDELARYSYEPRWPLSYHYHGEDANLRRYYFDPEMEKPHRQMHIRLWKTEGKGTKMYAHEEPSPVQHPIAHLRGVYMNAATDWAAEAYGGKGGRSLTLDPQNFDPDGEKKQKQKSK